MSNPIQFQNTGWATRLVLIRESLTGNEAPSDVLYKNFIHYVKANGLTTFYEQKGFDAIFEVVRSIEGIEQLAHLRKALIAYMREIKHQSVGDSHHENVKIRHITNWIESFVNEL